MIVSPAFVFSLMLATFYGALAHLIVGGNGRRLLSLVLASWLGFALGHAVGRVLDVRLLEIGTTNLLGGSVGALIGLILMIVLTAQRPRPHEGQ